MDDTEREESERLARQWEEIATTPLDCMFPIVERVEAKDREGSSVQGQPADSADKETLRLHSHQINENQRELESLATIMLGKNGEGGFVRELKGDLKEVLSEVGTTKTIVETEVRARITKDAQIEAKFEKQKNDIDNIGDIARGARDAVSTLISDRKEINKMILKQLLAIGGPFLLVAIGAIVFVAKFVAAAGVAP